MAQLRRRGVEVVDPRQTYVGPGVRLERIHAGVVLHPGTRLLGARTLLSPGAVVGSEGPAALTDAVLGERACVASGFVHGAVLLRDARIGAAAHVRPGTLLAEEASTAHAVGLKHTILLPFVTIGSCVNFCDILVAGGTSRKDHSEVGSGYIHFNFTPWGERGDKATASLVGDVPRGVLLRERRIFLGGAGGMVGPRSVGFGAIAGAGQVLRKDVDEGHLSLQPLKARDRPMPRDFLDRQSPRRARNVRYIANLVALRAWYREARLARVSTWKNPAKREVIKEAIATLDLAIAERIKRLAAFVKERKGVAPAPLPDRAYPCPLKVADVGDKDADHIDWVRALPDDARAQLREWLTGIVNDVCLGDTFDRA